MIQYRDEYDTLLYEHKDITNPPIRGELVVVDGVDWYVQSRSYYLSEGVIVVTVSENPVIDKNPQAKEDRLNGMKAAILEVQQKQNKQDKRVKALREQAMDIRAHIRAQERKAK